MSELRDRYFSTLGIDVNGACAKEKIARSLNRAYQLRTFEIEHYWKRATYFWGFQIAIFAAFGFLWKATDSILWTPITVALSGLGVLTAIANSLSARGSKFWQQNWEHHIDMLEDEIEGRLHKTVWLDRGRISFSVSRVNQLLSCYFIVFWAVITLYVLSAYLASQPTGWSTSLCSRLALVLAFALAMTCAVLWLCRQTSRIEASIPNTNGTHGVPVRQSTRWSRRVSRTVAWTFVRRYAPDEPPP